MKQLKNVIGGMFGSGVRELRKLIPQELSPEKQLMNATAGGLALMVMADGVIEEDETVNAITFLLDLPCVCELGMQQDAAEMYERHVDSLEEAHNEGAIRFAVKKSEIIGEISLLKDLDEEYRQHMIAMLDVLTSGGGADASEVEMKEAILKKLV